MRNKRAQKLTPLQQKRLWRTCALLVVAAFLWLLLAPGFGLISLLRTRSNFQKLQAETNALDVENKKLREEIDKLKNDPAYLEEIARRDYGLLKPHERIYDFSEPEKNKK